MHRNNNIAIDLIDQGIDLLNSFDKDKIYSEEEIKKIGEILANLFHLKNTDDFNKKFLDENVRLKIRRLYGNMSEVDKEEDEISISLEDAIDALKKIKEMYCNRINNLAYLNIADYINASPDEKATMMEVLSNADVVCLIKDGEIEKGSAYYKALVQLKNNLSIMDPILKLEVNKNKEIDARTHEIEKMHGIKYRTFQVNLASPRLKSKDRNIRIDQQVKSLGFLHVDDYVNASVEERAKIRSVVGSLDTLQVIVDDATKQNIENKQNNINTRAIKELRKIKRCQIIYEPAKGEKEYVTVNLDKRIERMEEINGFSYEAFHITRSGSVNDDSNKARVYKKNNVQNIVIDKLDNDLNDNVFKVEKLTKKGMSTIDLLDMGESILKKFSNDFAENIWHSLIQLDGLSYHLAEKTINHSSISLPIHQENLNENKASEAALVLKLGVVLAEIFRINEKEFNKKFPSNIRTTLYNLIQDMLATPPAQISLNDAKYAFAVIRSAYQHSHVNLKRLGYIDVNEYQAASSKEKREMLSALRSFDAVRLITNSNKNDIDIKNVAELKQKLNRASIPVFNQVLNVNYHSFSSDIASLEKKHHCAYQAFHVKSPQSQYAAVLENDPVKDMIITTKMIKSPNYYKNKIEKVIREVSMPLKKNLAKVADSVINNIQSVDDRKNNIDLTLKRLGYVDIKLLSGSKRLKEETLIALRSMDVVQLTSHYQYDGNHIKNIISMMRDNGINVINDFSIISLEKDKREEILNANTETLEKSKLTCYQAFYFSDKNSSVMDLTSKVTDIKIVQSNNGADYYEKQVQRKLDNLTVRNKHLDQVIRKLEERREAIEIKNLQQKTPRYKQLAAINKTIHILQKTPNITYSNLVVLLKKLDTKLIDSRQNQMAKNIDKHLGLFKTKTTAMTKNLITQIEQQAGLKRKR